ncbi:transposase [Frankia casuarinae]|uniref:transposase n=1 Tax=Frankia casuarinae (strain DSM 45818 / CECT 9043 / HFP020203 / CcI3) TaxID=106370 RepID=UPI0012FE99C6|nr:transposase [Frankia casuarinae]
MLSFDEKTQVQALDRTQPLLPITFDATEKRTHDYVRHGTTNLFATIEVGTGKVFGECRPTRTGDDFLEFVKKAVKPHNGKEIHIILALSRRQRHACFGATLKPISRYTCATLGWYRLSSCTRERC